MSCRQAAGSVLTSDLGHSSSRFDDQVISLRGFGGDVSTTTRNSVSDSGVDIELRGPAEPTGPERNPRGAGQSNPSFLHLLPTNHFIPRFDTKTPSAALPPIKCFSIAKPSSGVYKPQPSPSELPGRNCKNGPGRGPRLRLHFHGRAWKAKAGGPQAHPEPVYEREEP